MNPRTQGSWHRPSILLIFSFFLTTALLLWQGHVGLSLWDEGFLLYGVQRVLLGEVPIRDFQAYDPGRYYLVAAIMRVIGDHSILSFRTATALFQTLGLFTGLLLITQAKRSQNHKSSLTFLCLSAVTLMVWMYVRHRAIDYAMPIFLVGVLAFLVSKPIPVRYFIAGVGVGLVAVFGRNHGIYGAAGTLGVMIFLAIRHAPKSAVLRGALLWGAGVIAGFLPVILMTILIPGFASAFRDDLLFLFERKSTNLPLPVPWPWALEFSAMPWNRAIDSFLTSFYFMAVLAFGVIAVIWIVYRVWKGKSVSSVLVASASLALPYAHYSFSRADTEHLSLGVFPLLLSCLAALSVAKARVKWGLVTILCLTSVWLILPSYPGWQCAVSGKCVHIEVFRTPIQVIPEVAFDISRIRDLARRYAPGDQPFIAAPFWPGAYALLERRSPMWSIYAILPRSESFQKKEIERIKAASPGFAYILNWPLDHRKELTFKNTHPLVYQYITDHFERLPRLPHSPYYAFEEAFRSKEARISSPLKR